MIKEALQRDIFKMAKDKEKKLTEEGQARAMIDGTVERLSGPAVGATGALPVADLPEVAAGLAGGVSVPAAYPHLYSNMGAAMGKEVKDFGGGQSQDPYLLMELAERTGQPLPPPDSPFARRYGVESRLGPREEYRDLRNRTDSGLREALTELMERNTSLPEEDLTTGGDWRDVLY